MYEYTDKVMVSVCEVIVGDISHKHVLPRSQPHFSQVIRRDHKASVIANGIRAIRNFNEYPSSCSCIDS